MATATATAQKPKTKGLAANFGKSAFNHYGKSKGKKSRKKMPIDPSHICPNAERDAQGRQPHYFLVEWRPVGKKAAIKALPEAVHSHEFKVCQHCGCEREVLCFLCRLAEGNPVECAIRAHEMEFIESLEAERVKNFNRASNWDF